MGFMAEPDRASSQEGIGSCETGLTGGNKPRLRFERNELPTTHKRLRLRAAIKWQLSLIDANA